MMKTLLHIFRRVLSLMISLFKILQLRNLPGLDMKRFEIEGQDVNLYFDQVSNK